MERLTKRDKNLGNIIYLGDGIGIDQDMNNNNLTYAYGDAIDRLAEYEDAEEASLIKRLPCKEGTLIYHIHKDCEAIHWREEYKPSKEFDKNCIHYHPDFYECEEYCDCQDDYEHYCSQNLEIYCDRCKERLTIHKDYFNLSKITQIYGTAQYKPTTKLEDTYFLTIEEAKAKLKELQK